MKKAMNKKVKRNDVKSVRFAGANTTTREELIYYCEIEDDYEENISSIYKIADDDDDEEIRMDLFMYAFKVIETDGYSNMLKDLKSIKDIRVWQTFEKRRTLQERFFESKQAIACRNVYGDWIIIFGWNAETDTVYYMEQAKNKESSAKSILDEYLVEVLNIQYRDL